MNPDDFNNALKIALRYFALSGINDMSIMRPLGLHIHNLFQEGENRPLMLANRAIERMERELEAQMEITAEQLNVTFHRNV